MSDFIQSLPRKKCRIYLFIFILKKKLLIFNPALNLNKSSETKINKSTLHIMWEMTQKSLNHLLPPSGNQLAPPTSQEPPHASWKKCPVAIPRKNYPSDSNETRPTHTHTHTHTHTLTHWHTDTPSPLSISGAKHEGRGDRKRKKTTLTGLIGRKYSSCFICRLAFQFPN